MTPRKMDHESVERIARARGRRDSFSRRAEIAVRNQSHEEGKGNKEETKPAEKQNVEEQEKKEDKAKT
ncbi:hypothetical protein E0Z10_g8519 [Xylaria hypoxylon]|uniref:Uncharacterized protein n=1 Tax=Xylaria hypoxylon TaxID=37992 RepID=A0A4Z0YUV0_9PEZI|nr:hypothetical protein E0Z10_g8519 [Xylaria hypoxylon]